MSHRNRHRRSKPAGAAGPRQEQRERQQSRGQEQRGQQQSRREEQIAARYRQRRRRLIRRVGIATVVVTALVVGVVFWSLNQKTLPPTSFGPGHLEQFPARQINNQPIDPRIQEHVMERGGGHHRIGSMLVQYNCVRFDCDPGMVKDLEDIVRGNPSNVYLAPYPKMDAKIALAAPGRLLVLDEFDRNRIAEFIRANRNR